ncbi:MAG TPA: glycoside hydrolase family 48 protein, partial [Streptosporangiaceae bacterium]|nr:glycoside hydrolase family 48 protein [Streptosporangiaceae bacterium]
ITSWTLAYSYAGNQALSQGWSGNWTQSGKTITVTNASWNGSLAAGATTQIGANFTYTGTNTPPAAFTLNGTTCNGASPSPSPSPTTSPTTSPSPSPSPTTSSSPPPAGAAPMVSITSPTAGEIFSPGSAITLRASPVTGSGTVKTVTFYQSTTAANDTEIGVATASPWAIQSANVPTGNYSITAVAGNGSESLTSYPVAITVESPTVVVNPNSIAVQQGATGTVGVALSAQPSASVTVSVAENSGGDSDLSVSAGASLTFTTSNWSVPQNVTVAAGTAASGGGGQGTFTASAPGYNSGSTAVTEALPAGSQSKYDQWFLNLYDTIMNPANGYFSPKGIPYHSVETLIVEAPDYGHETTSETYSYYLWLTADYGRVTGRLHSRQLDRDLSRGNPAQLVHQHLPVHPSVVYRRPAVVQGPGLPERRVRAKLQLPQILGRGGYRHRLRFVRAAVPHRGAAVRVLASIISNE